MDPDACVERIVNAINDSDLEEALEAVNDLENWIRRGGFPPSHESAQQLRDLSVAGDVKGRIHEIRLKARFPDHVRGRDFIQDILNPGDASDDARLTFVRLDDRGDLGAYVWGPMSCDDAIEYAMEHAEAQGWEVDEDDATCFDVIDFEEHEVVLFRSALLVE